MKIKCYSNDGNLVKEIEVKDGQLTKAPFTLIANDLGIIHLSPIYFENSNEGLQTRLTLGLTEKEKDKLLKKLRVYVRRQNEKYNYSVLKLAEIFLNFKKEYRLLKGELMFLFGDSNIDNFTEVKEEIEELDVNEILISEE